MERASHQARQVLSGACGERLDNVMVNEKKGNRVSQLRCLDWGIAYDA